MPLQLKRLTVLSLSVLLLAASSEAAKRVSLDTLDTDIVVQTRIRHATVIVLPDSEQILDFVAGDSETWAVSGAVNVAYVKPGEEGARTNIALICASGNIYSFRVHENSDAEPDLVVYVDYAAAPPLAAGESRSKRPEPHEPKFISRMDVAIYQEAAEQAERNARAAWDQAERRMTEAIDRFRSSYPTLIRFEYSLEKKAERPPFEIAGMWHDGRFTYVRSHATESPALYESRDGKPSLVSYELTPGGLFIVNRVLHDGFFQIGKERAKWRRVPPDRQPDPQLREGLITLTADTEDTANAVPESAAEVAPR